jgi:Cutinase
MPGPGRIASVRFGFTLIIAAALIGLGWAVISSGAVTPRAASVACPRVIVYYSRGSGQGLGDKPSESTSPRDELHRALDTTYPAANSLVANAYPAVSIRIELFGHRPPSIPRRAKYLASVASGVQVARYNLVSLSELCPLSHLVVAGYSQGADVTRRAVAELPSDTVRHIAAVLLFGDPYFMPGEPGVTAVDGAADRHVGLLRQVHIGSPAPLPGALYGKVFSWCRPKDVFCQGAHFGSRRQPHFDYVLDVGSAAARIARLIPSPPSLHLHPGVKGFKVLGTCGHAGCTCVGAPCAVAVWNGPGTGFRPVGALYEGEPVIIACQVIGQPVTGPNAVMSDIWDRLASGGYVSDYWINTRRVDQFSWRRHACPGRSAVASRSARRRS